LQVFYHGVNKLGPAALWIQIFVAKNQCAVLLVGALRRSPEGKGMT
jgi:hypothetical protein